MNEKFKKFLTAKNISEADFATKTAQEMGALYNEFYQKELENKADKTEIPNIADVLKDYLQKEDLQKLFEDEKFKALQTQLENVQESVNTIKDGLKNDSAVAVSIRQAIKEELLKNKDAIEKMKQSSNEKVSMNISMKAVQAMTFATNTTGNVGRVERQAEIVDILRRTPILLDLVNSGNTNASVYEWIEKSGHEGGVEMVAEGAVKPQGDWDLTLYSQKPKKEAIIVTVSKEMLDDIDGMAQDIQDEIYEQIRIFTDTAILDGDGLSNNIEGIDANATPFAAGAFANTVIAANEFDALRVGVNQVELNNDFPNYILMHPTDATKMELIKDATTSQYIMPPFSSMNGTTIKGLPVRTSTVVTQGEAYVGNFNRFKVKIRENITFEMGYRGAQGDWEKNMVSFIGEQRLFAFIPANHYGSIVKIDFAVAKALLDPAVADA